MNLFELKGYTMTFVKTLSHGTPLCFASNILLAPDDIAAQACLIPFFSIRVFS